MFTIQAVFVVKTIGKGREGFVTCRGEEGQSLSMDGRSVARGISTCARADMGHLRLPLSCIWPWWIRELGCPQYSLLLCCTVLCWILFPAVCYATSAELRPSLEDGSPREEGSHGSEPVGWTRLRLVIEGEVWDGEGGVEGIRR